jgi:hypothetical protein
MARVRWLGNFCALQLWRAREELEEWPANFAKEVGLSWRSLVLPELIVGQPSKILPQRGAQQVAYGSAGQTRSGIEFEWEWALAADTHLLLGCIITSSHGAKIGGVLAVNIPGVEIDGGRAFRKQGNGEEGSEAPMGMTRLSVRILFCCIGHSRCNETPRDLQGTSL